MVARISAIPVSTTPVMQVLSFRANFAAIQPFRVSRCSNLTSMTSFLRAVLASDAAVAQDGTDEVSS